MGVFTQLANNIKGFASKFVCKSAFASCVNGAEPNAKYVRQACALLASSKYRTPFRGSVFREQCCLGVADPSGRTKGGGRHLTQHDRHRAWLKLGLRPRDPHNFPPSPALLPPRTGAPSHHQPLAMTWAENNDKDDRTRLHKAAPLSGVAQKSLKKLIGVHSEQIRISC